MNETEQNMNGGTTSQYDARKAPYDRNIVIILCLLGFVGFAGLHRMYVGRIKSGILWFLTGGLFSIGTFYDIYKIFTNEFEDNDGKLILP